MCYYCHDLGDSSLPCLEPGHLLSEYLVNNHWPASWCSVSYWYLKRTLVKKTCRVNYTAVIIFGAVFLGTSELKQVHSSLDYLHTHMHNAKRFQLRHWSLPSPKSFHCTMCWLSPCHQVATLFIQQFFLFLGSTKCGVEVRQLRHDINKAAVYHSLRSLYWIIRRFIHYLWDFAFHLELVACREKKKQHVIARLGSGV